MAIFRKHLRLSARAQRFGAAAVLLFAALLPCATPAHAAHERLQAGDPVRFVLQTTRGRLTSTKLEGRTYAVVFWNTGSKKFAQELPKLRALVKQRAEQGFVLIGYSVDPSVNKARQAIAERGLNWVQALDQEQGFPFYDLFYTQRSPVPGAFLVSDTGELAWFGPLSHLTDQVAAVLPAIESEADPQAGRVAAGLVYRTLLQKPPHVTQVLDRLREVPDGAWEADRNVRLSLRRAARQLSRLDEDVLLALRQAAAADPDDAERFERLWALRPEPRPAGVSPLDETAAQSAETREAPDPSAAAARALNRARAAEAQDDLLTAWEQFRAAANDPDAGEHGPAAQAELQRMESKEDFAQRLAAARRERAASDLYVKALNLITAGKTKAADATLREIRRNYHDTDTADAAERAIENLASEQ